MVDNYPIPISKKSQEMWEHTPWPQPPVPAPWLPTLDPRPSPWSLENFTFCVLELFGLLMLQNPHLAVPTLNEAEAAGTTSHVDVDQQPLGESAGGNRLPNVLLPSIHLWEACLDSSVEEQSTSRRVEEEVMLVAIRIRLGLYGFSIGWILFIALWDIAHAVILQFRVFKETTCDGVEDQ